MDSFIGFLSSRHSFSFLIHYLFFFYASKISVGGRELKLKDNFNLSAPVIKAELEDETHFVQLIAKQPNGNMRIR